MARLEEDYRRCKNGMIDYDHYREVAARLRRGSRRRLLRAAVAALMRYFKFMRYFKLPQNRWMRRQASSRSSVRVA